MNQAQLKQILPKTASIKQYLLSIIFITATIATLGSLNFSLNWGLEPCTLCWYQRILMYPLVPISVYAIYRDELFTPLISGLAAFGLGIAAYHSYIQYLALNTVCTSSTPCHTVQYAIYGLSIPNLATIAFTIILGVSLTAHYKLA